MPFRILSDEESRSILDVIRSVLLTRRGIRTLSPHHPDYKGDYHGDQSRRDSALHQGTVWPWLSGHFMEAWLNIYGQEGLKYVRELFYLFEEAVKDDGLGTISEVYDGNPPHRSGGCYSYAGSVAEMLRMNTVIESVFKG